MNRYSPLGLLTDPIERLVYFRERVHSRDIIWTAGYKSHGLDFGDLEAAGYHVIDQFHGNFPRFHDAKNPQGTDVGIKTVPSMILDSNVVAEVVSYVEQTMKDPKSRVRVERFLTWFASTPNIILTPAYHFLEALSQSSDEGLARRMARRSDQALRSIELMDRDHYRMTKTIRQSRYAQDALHATFGTDDLAAIAAKQAESLPQLVGTPEAFNCYLLKVALIEVGLPRREALAQKVEQLVHFIESKLGKTAVFEIVVALLHFSGRLKKFLTLSRNMTFERATEKIWHAAWDCLFMRMPQIFLSHPIQDHTIVGFLITKDMDSVIVLRIPMFQLMIVPERGPFYSFCSADLDVIGEKSWRSRETIFDEARLLIQEMARRRPSATREPDITALTRELHQELRNYLDH